ncbi:MAG: hypothetical protein AAFW69_01730, partial [Pseudomonadota bacterium]
LAKMGLAALARGEVEAARAVVEEIAARADAPDAGTYMWYWRAAFLARFHRAVGNRAATRRELSAGLARVRANGERGHEAALLLAGAEVLEGDPARAHAEAAAVIAAELDLPPVRAAATLHLDRWAASG